MSEIKMEFTEFEELGNVSSPTQIKFGKSIFSLFIKDGILIIYNKLNNLQYELTPRSGYRINNFNVIEFNGKPHIVWSELYIPSTNNYVSQLYLSVLEKEHDDINTIALFPQNVRGYVNFINTIIHNNELLIFMSGYDPAALKYSNYIFSYDNITVSPRDYLNTFSNYELFRLTDKNIFSLNGKLYLFCISGSTKRSLHLVSIENEVVEINLLINGNYSNNYMIAKIILFKNNFYIHYNEYSRVGIIYKVDDSSNNITTTIILRLGVSSAGIDITMNNNDDYIFVLTRISNTSGGYTAGYGYDFYDGTNFTGSVASIDSFEKIKNFDTDRSYYEVLSLSKIKNEHYITIHKKYGQIDIYKKNGDTVNKVITKIFSKNSNATCAYIGSVDDELYFDLTYNVNTTSSTWIGEHYLAKFDGLNFTETKIEKDYYQLYNSILVGKIFYIVFSQRVNSTVIYYIGKIDLTQFNYFIVQDNKYKKWYEDITPPWQIISSSLPTIEVFKSKGMQDLTTLDRKETKFTQNMINNGSLGEGKIFKSTIDLKRLFEITKIEAVTKTPVYATETAVPQMTSNTTPSGRAFASSINSTTNDAWRAFDVTATAFSTENGSGGVGYLGYEFANPTIIGKYTIRSTGSVTYSPKDWTFEGSNDGTNWDVLDTQVNQSWTTANTDKEYIIDTNKVSKYKMYRLNWTANNGGITRVDINEMQMFEISYGWV